MSGMQVAVTGASGMIGTALGERLRAAGHTVVPLVRRRDADGIFWDPATGGIDAASLEGFDAVVHLAGANVGQRWTSAHRHAIRHSRVAGTDLLARTLAGLTRPPGVLACASASGYYGEGGETLLSEAAPRGEGFLAEVVEAWENASAPAADAGIRVVRFRQAMVLHPRSGALGRLALVVRLGIGGRLGSGRQWWSWVDIDDVTGAYQSALERSEISGTYNLAAPCPERNADFVKILARQLQRPAIVPAPAFALRLVQGRELADQMLLASQRLSPARLEAAGFRCAYPELDGSLTHLYEEDLPSDREK